MNQVNSTPLPPGWIKCTECEGKPAGIKFYNYARGSSHTDWCIRCNGDRRVFVGVVPDEPILKQS